MAKSGGTMIREEMENRKKLCEKAKKLCAPEALYELQPYIGWGLVKMLRHGESGPSREAVGAAKVLLLAQKLKKYEDTKLHRDGKNGLVPDELYDAVKDIYEA